AIELPRLRRRKAVTEGLTHGGHVVSHASLFLTRLGPHPQALVASRVAVADPSIKFSKMPAMDLARRLPAARTRASRISIAMPLDTQRSCPGCAGCVHGG